MNKPQSWVLAALTSRCRSVRRKALNINLCFPKHAEREYGSGRRSEQQRTETSTEAQDATGWLLYSTAERSAGDELLKANLINALA